MYARLSHLALVPIFQGPRSTKVLRCVTRIVLLVGVDKTGWWEGVMGGDLTIWIVPPSSSTFISAAFVHIYILHGESLILP